MHKPEYPYLTLERPSWGTVDQRLFPRGIGYGWNPSNAMPRWASRLTLVVADVQVAHENDTWWWDVTAERVKDGR